MLEIGIHHGMHEELETDLETRQRKDITYSEGNQGKGPLAWSVPMSIIEYMKIGKPGKYSVPATGVLARWYCRVIRSFPGLNQDKAHETETVA